MQRGHGWSVTFSERSSHVRPPTHGVFYKIADIEVSSNGILMPINATRSCELDSGKPSDPRLATQ